MRIAEYVPNFYPSLGGTELATASLAAVLVGLGHEPLVLTFETRKKYLDYAPVFNYKIMRFGYLALFSQSLRFSPSLLLAFRKMKADLLHIQGLHQLLNFTLMAMQSKSLGIPVVMTAHGITETIEAFERSHTSRFFKIWLKIVDLFISKYIALSETGRITLANYGIEASKIVVIPNGVEVEDLLHGPQEPPAFAGELEEGFVVCVARFAPNKNLELLINAFKGLDCRPKLVIAGSVTNEGYYSNLVKLAKPIKSIFLLPNASPQALRWLRQNCMFGVLTSFSETSPLSLLEIMATGKPVVASDVGSVKELVRNHYSGLLFKNKDKHALIICLKELIDNRDKRAVMGRNAKTTAASRTWDSVGRTTIDTMRAIVKENSSNEDLKSHRKGKRE
ncbi:MAG: glycosyltransferase family 4 protein [Nitrososphaerota archaeon]|nr:glycosyltransferase family 4 protein [Nitrososphaerota archaeon]